VFFGGGSKKRKGEGEKKKRKRILIIASIGAVSMPEKGVGYVCEVGDLSGLIA